jgi:hypothetical protein
MAKVIEVVLPNTDHRLCSWHVEQNMVRHLRGKTEKLSDQYLSLICDESLIYRGLNLNLR